MFNQINSGTLAMFAVAVVTFTFLGMMLACIIYGDSDRIPPWRHGFVLVFVILSADSLRWDLTHTIQYPLARRIALSGLAAGLGIFTYVRLFVRTRR